MWHSGRCAFLLALAALVFVGPGTAHAAMEGGSGARLSGADAPLWWFGFQLRAVTDGAAPALASDTMDAYKDLDSMHFDWGGGLAFPLALNLYRGLGMRVLLALTYSGDPPFDKAVAQISFLEQQESGAWSDRQYRTRPAFFVAGALATDVQYMFPLLFGAVKPYLGVGPGLYLNYVFTDITEDEYVLLANEYNDPNDDNNIDPYSVGLEPGFNSYLGLNFLVSGGMHLNFEVQYDLARFDEAPLLKATDEADARRAAYTYSVVTISTGLIFNF